MPKFVAPLLVAAGCMAAALPASLPAAAADERGSFLDERPGFDEPLRFRDERGGAFRPRSLVVTGAGGAVAARLPGAADAYSENRVDLSGAPVIGQLFRGTLDVATVRQGALVGPVYRVGNALVVDAASAPVDVTARPVALATNLPRYGAVSYPLGPLDWRAAMPPAAAGVQVGTAHIVDGALVLASRGGEPAYPSVEALFNDLF